ncbi:LytTR family DNA-binding domain-containing protein [Erythrobacter sp. T5W1-R]|uniref:LytTR family DNA-binding domain-containing protein n=1 Tax=Erythrobacter sp. T5W1-R TaxID=3101752 RepID=UPI002AFF81C3|nr:LytTR family DNA-binding domain-containing protein [Erythrobacter sp. T5W1-R]MEA1617643.1 LytTR family DNA-binding domain-containing protein [Erythrobacter sp. T5W1-R]
MSGGERGTSGEQRYSRLLRDARALVAIAYAGFGLLYMAVNAVSLIDQRRALGQPIPPWQAWTLEGTSFVAWLALLPIILLVAIRLSPRPVWQAAIGHALACLTVSLAHTVLMALLRSATFAIGGQDYLPDMPLSERVLFEARKDVITYASILAVFLLARRLTTTPSASLSPHVEPALIEVRDGSRVVMLHPEEIDWVNAAGNYVELHGSFGSELARRTMADVEAELAAHGFVRIHRSRLVRRTAIASAQTRQSGDFDITLRSGKVIGGSRRFRQNLG